MINRFSFITRAVASRWPRDLADAYLKVRLDYALTPERMKGVDLFFRKAHEHGIIAGVRDVRTLA